MAELSRVSLVVARKKESPIVANLLELYAHELSAVFPSIQIGEDGRFGYSRLPLYWSEPERRFPFLIRREGKLAGFVLATRGSPASDDPEALDVAEFFVLRNQRGRGVGQEAANALWARLPGSWTVRVSENNRLALPFWERTTRNFWGDRVVQAVTPGQPHAWRVFRLG